MSVPELDEADPRRWFTLAVVITAVLIVALDTTVLNVAIPTILREFHTDAAQPAVGDHRLLADVRDPADHRRPPRRHLRRTGGCSSSAPRCSASARCSRRSRTSVPMLIVGEAIIEGIGASLMMPATLGDPVDDVPRATSGRRRSRCGARPPAPRSRSARGRRLPHHELLVALGVPHQRDRRARSRSSARCCSCAASPSARRAATASTCPARCSSRPGCSCSCSG